MRKNNIHINKESNSIVTLLFFMLLIFYPQFGYAEYKVQVNAPLYGDVTNDEDSGVKLLGMGVSDLGSGEYQAEFLIKNSRQYQETIELNNDYIFELTDGYGQVHDVEIDKRKTRYSAACGKGRLAAGDCLVTIAGSTGTGHGSIYKSFRVSTSYRNERRNENARISFMDDMPKLKVQGIAKTSSQKSGGYEISIENVSLEDMDITMSSSGSGYISLNSPANTRLSANTAHKIMFWLSGDLPEGSSFDEYVNIDYTLVQNGAKSKRVLIPIKVSREENGGWRVVVGTVITVALVAAGGAIVYFFKNRGAGPRMVGAGPEDDGYDGGGGWGDDGNDGDDDRRPPHVPPLAAVAPVVPAAAAPIVPVAVVPIVPPLNVAQMGDFFQANNIRPRLRGRFVAMRAFVNAAILAGSALPPAPH